jgi:hypothetical protein
VSGTAIEAELSSGNYLKIGLGVNAELDFNEFAKGRGYCLKKAEIASE